MLSSPRGGCSVKKAPLPAHGPYKDHHGFYYLLPLSGGFEAKISPEDVERVQQFKWTASREGRNGVKIYAIRFVWQGEKRVKIRLHRFVLDMPPGFMTPDLVVDHIGDDGLDCRRSRLEPISQRENMLRTKNWDRKQSEPCL